MIAGATEEAVSDRTAPLAVVAQAPGESPRGGEEANHTLTMAQVGQRSDGPQAPAAGAPRVVEPPADSERRAVEVTEGMVFAQEHPAQDPDAAQGVVDGQNAVVPQGEPRNAGPQTPPVPALVATLVVQPPADSERRVVEITEGMALALEHPAYDPNSARYLVDGQDLVVTLASGGILVLGGFFAVFDQPPVLSVMGSSAVSAQALLNDAHTQVVIGEITPAGDRGDLAADRVDASDRADAPEQGYARPVTTFASYEPGEIDGGLPPLGREAAEQPVELETVSPRVTPVQDAMVPEQETVAPVVIEAPSLPMPVESPPTVTVRERVEASIVDVVVGYTPPWMPPALPDDGPAVPGDGPTDPGGGTPGPDPGAIANGLPAAFVTLDREREVMLRLDSVQSDLRSALGAFKINADGTLTDVRIAYADTNGTADGSAPISLGSFAKGETFGLFLLKDGAALNDVELLKGGRYEIRDAAGNRLDVDNYVHDPANPPILVRVDELGNVVEQLKGELIFSTDPTDDTAGENVLNRDGLAHVIHGYDPFSGRVVVGFDDGTVGTGGTFDDVRVSIEYGVAFETRIVVQLGGLLNFAVDDPDGDLIGGALVRLRGETVVDGDLLTIPGSLGSGSWAIAGTNIIAQLLGTEIHLSGVDTALNYEHAMNLIRFTTLSGEPGLGGDRLIDIQVTDEDGNWSSVSTTLLHLVDNRVDLREDPGYDGSYDAPGAADHGVSVLGTLGRDVVTGGEESDTLIGGAGDDILVGGGGSDTILGGPGNDELIGGAGADMFVVSALSENRNVIADFNGAEGDRLRLEDLITDPSFDPTAANAADWLRFQAGGGREDPYVSVTVDLDGAGSRYGAVEMFRLLDIEDPASLTIENATTYGRLFNVEPEAAAAGSEAEPEPETETAHYTEPLPVLPLEPLPPATDGATV